MYRIKIIEPNIIFDGEYLTIGDAKHHINIYMKLDARNGKNYSYAVVDESANDIEIVKKG